MAKHVKQPSEDRGTVLFAVIVEASSRASNRREPVERRAGRGADHGRTRMAAAHAGMRGARVWCSERRGDCVEDTVGDCFVAAAVTTMLTQPGDLHDRRAAAQPREAGCRQVATEGSDMTVQPPSPEQLSEVLRLCTVLSDRALDAKIMGREMPADHMTALAKAARLLQDHGVEWPPLLTQVLHEAADRADHQASETRAQVELPADIDAQGLTRFFAALWKEKSDK